MADGSDPPRTLRERIGGNAEERLGKALSELLESPLFTGAVGRAFEAREKAAQAQEVALGALNLPSAADIERLTRRLRAVTHRLEGIEEGVDRLDSSFSAQSLEARLTGIEQTLEGLLARVDVVIGALEAPPAATAGLAPPASEPKALPGGPKAPRRRPRALAAKADPAKAGARPKPKRAAAKRRRSSTP